MKKPIRVEPFILKIGDSFTIVVDKRPFLQVSMGSVEALIHLIGVYFLFNIEWSKEVFATCLFLQKEVLRIEDEPTFRTSKALQLFLKTYSTKVLPASTADDAAATPVSSCESDDEDY